MKKIVILISMFLMMFVVSCSNTSKTSQEPSVNSINSESNKVITMKKLKNSTTSIGNINMFDSVEESLYTGFQILNTYDEFNSLKNNYNSNKYVFQKLIDLLKNENYEKAFFENKSLIISPFLHSSDEKNISFLELQIDDSLKTIDITFQYEAPEFVDFDVIVDYFIIEVDKQNFTEKSDYIKNIHGYNLLTNSNESSCYR